MKTPVLASVLAISALAAVAAGSALAQPRGGGQGGPAITLYDLPNFQGPSRTYFNGVDNLADLGLNDRAQSAKVQGRWRLCTDAKMRGRCVDVNSDIANLATIGVTAAVSSFETVDRPGGGYGGGYDRNRDGDRGPGFGPPGGFNRNLSGPSLEGTRAVFFPRPQPGPYRGAADFCRRMGFRGVLWADDRGFEIRDVLCER
jgi:hypothetical protein